MDTNKFSPGRNNLPLGSLICIFFQYFFNALTNFFLRFNLAFICILSVLYFLGGYGMEGEEPYPSLSDCHDYEPKLEFDDTELHQSPDAIANTGNYLYNLSCNLFSF